MDSADLVGEIQSSDVSSQGSFIDINGLLIPQQSVLSLNNQDLLFNLQDTNQLVPNKIIFGNVLNQKKVKSVKMKSTANVSLLKTASECADFVQKSSSVFDSSGLFRVVNEDGSNAVLNVDGVFIEKPSETNGELQLTAVDEEPDSTVTNDESDEQLNIDELATVITAYRCKKCEFTCNDREQFFVHFKEIHMKPVSAY